MEGVARHLVIPFPASIRAAVLALMTLPLLPASGGGAGLVDAPPAVVHDLHIAYGDLAVEGSVIAGRFRFFRDDLEAALGALVGASALSLEPGPEVDALVLRLFRAGFQIEIDGVALEATLLNSGEDELDREPVWWILVQFQAPGAIETFTVRNTLLFDHFEDQRNICKFVHFPDATPRTYYFAHGESEHRVRF